MCTAWQNLAGLFAADSAQSFLACGGGPWVVGGFVQAEKLVAQFEELGCVLGDLGLAFIKIAKYEDEEGAKTGAYTDSSAAARDISANAKRVGMVRLQPHAQGSLPECAPKPQVC